MSLLCRSSAGYTSSFWDSGSRASTMVKRAQKNTAKVKGSTNVLATASSWGIQIKHVKLVLTWIDNYKSNLQKPVSSSRRASHLITRTRGNPKKHATSLSPPPALKRLRRRMSLQRASVGTTPISATSPVSPWTPSPTPLKVKRTQKAERQKRLKQVQRRLSFSGFVEDEPFSLKIVTAKTRLALAKKGSSTSSSSTSAKRRKDAAIRRSHSTPSVKRNKDHGTGGSYTDLITTRRHHHQERRGSRRRERSSRDGQSRKRRRSRSENITGKMTKRTRRISEVIQDLMHRLDDAKTNTTLHGAVTTIQDKNSIKTMRVRRRRPPKRACQANGTKKRLPRAVPIMSTVNKVARKLKKELAVTSPVICTMSLRNGKMKFSES